MRQNSKRQNTNVTKHKKTYCKYDQKTKRQNTNVTKYKRTKYKCDNKQKTKFKYDITQKDTKQI